MNRLYKLYYSFLIILALIFGIALYQSYSEKEELKQTLFDSYANIIKISINKFIEVKNQHEVITPQMVKEFMKDLDFNYKDFEVKFLFKENKNRLKEELKILDYLKKDSFYKTFGIWERNYYTAIKDKNIKEKYKSLFIPNTGDIIGVLVFFEDEDRMDNIGGNIEENFDGKVGLFVSVYIALAILGFVLLRMARKYFDVIEEKNQLEIDKEVAKKNEKLKSEFLANMSHEIRTPLNAMFGFIKLLEEKTTIDKEESKYLSIIKKSGEMVLNIINDILDFSKIEEGKISIESIPFNLKDELESVYHLFESKANEKELTIIFKEENLDKYVLSDPIRIKQIISNLLSNAIKFTPRGKTIYFRAKYEDEKLFVEIEDEGIGIPNNKLLTIFEPFSQADTSTTRKYGGTGLGLTISYELVKLLNGKLNVESQEAKGSKFSIIIPLKETKEIKTEAKKIDNEKFNFNLLLVEDNKANQMFMSVILKKLGLTFDIAHDGIEGVEKYRKNHEKYDFILMDENMPNMTGSEATKYIRDFEIENNLKPICIIALTANALNGDRSRFLKAGMDEYLSKPLDVDKLKEILRKLKLKREK